MKTIILLLSGFALVKALCDRDCECQDAFYSHCSNPSSDPLHAATLELCIANCAIYAGSCKFVLFLGHMTTSNCLTVFGETYEEFLGSCSATGGPLFKSKDVCYADSEGLCQSSACESCTSCDGDKCYGVTETICSMVGHTHHESYQDNEAQCQKYCMETKSSDGSAFTYFTYQTYDDTCSCFSSGARSCGAQVVKADVSAETAESCLDPTIPDPTPTPSTTQNTPTPETTITTPEPTTPLAPTTPTHEPTTTTPMFTTTTPETTSPEATTTSPEPTTQTTETTTQTTEPTTETTEPTSQTTEPTTQATEPTTQTTEPTTQATEPTSQTTEPTTQATEPTTPTTEPTTQATEPTTQTTEPTAQTTEPTPTAEPTAASTQAPGCPGVEGVGFCYWLLQKFETRDECRTVCLVDGADLVSIHSEEEERIVIDLIHEHGSPKGVWLGGQGPGWDKEEWTWDDGTPWDFEKWRWSYPNIDDELACLYTEARGIPTDDDGGWMDGVCWKVEDRKDWDCICKRAN